MLLSQKRRFLRLMLGLAVLISGGILLTLIMARGGSLAGNIQVKDLSLCKSAIFSGEVSQTYSSRILSPTSVIYPCGYLAIDYAYSGDISVYFYLYRDGSMIFSPASYYHLPFHSQYFALEIGTSELLRSGKYRLNIQELDRKELICTIEFEINSDQK